MIEPKVFPQGAGSGTYFRRLPNNAWVMLNSSNQWVGVQDPTTWVAPKDQLPDQNETIVSLSQEIEKLRKDYDECDKKTLSLKLRIRHLEMVGTQGELYSLNRLINRLAKYEPDFKLDDNLFESNV